MIELTEKDADFVANLLREAKQGCYNSFIESEKNRTATLDLLKVSPPDIVNQALKESGIESLEDFDKEWVEHHNKHKALLDDFDQALLLLMGGSDER